VRRYAKVGRAREDRPVSEGSKDNVSMREREREIGLRPASHKFPATATNGIPAAHETRRCPISLFILPLPLGHHFRRCVRRVRVLGRHIYLPVGRGRVFQAVRNRRFRF
jgi:hypothetical protein